MLRGYGEKTVRPTINFAQPERHFQLEHRLGLRAIFKNEWCLFERTLFVFCNQLMLKLKTTTLLNSPHMLSAGNVQHRDFISSSSLNLCGISRKAIKRADAFFGLMDKKFSNNAPSPLLQKRPSASLPVDLSSLPFYSVVLESHYRAKALLIPFDGDWINYPQ